MLSRDPGLTITIVLAISSNSIKSLEVKLNLLFVRIKLYIQNNLHLSHLEWFPRYCWCCLPRAIAKVGQLFKSLARNLVKICPCLLTHTQTKFGKLHLYKIFHLYILQREAGDKYNLIMSTYITKGSRRKRSFTI